MLFHSEGYGVLPVVPRETHQTPGTLRHHANHELVDEWRHLPRGQIYSREVLVRVIVRAPLPGLTVEDQLCAGRRWKSPERVLAGGHDSGPEHQILVGREH